MKNKKEEKNNMKRREFMTKSGLGGLALYLGGPSLIHAAPSIKGQNIVSIFLRGGHDALSAVGPKNFDKLKAKRPDIAYQMTQNHHYYFGVNNQLNSLINLLENKDLSIIHGVGGVNETTSHFAQMDYIEGGHSQRILPTGFLARLADEINADKFAIEKSIPRSMKSHKYVLQFDNKSLLSNISPQNYKGKVGISREQFLQNFFGKGTPGLSRKVASAHKTKSKEVFNKIKNKSLVDKYKNNQIGLLAEMLTSKSPGVYSLSVGGWDHHLNLQSSFVNQTESLFSDLAKLVSDLKSHNKFNNTTIVVYSEFGRRIMQNGALGADHGRGGVSYIIGGKVNGGKILSTKDYVQDLKKKLSDTKESNPLHNLKVSYDIRSIFAEIFKKRLNLKQWYVNNKVFEGDLKNSSSAKDLKFLV